MRRFLFTLALLGATAATTVGCSVEMSGGDLPTSPIGGGSTPPDDNKPTPVEQQLVVSKLGAWNENRILIVNPTEDEAGALFAITPTEDVELKLIRTLESVNGCLPSQLQINWLGLRMIDKDSADQMFGVSLNQYFKLEKGRLYHLLLSIKGAKACSRFEYKFVAESK